MGFRISDQFLKIKNSVNNLKMNHLYKSCLNKFKDNYLQSVGTN